MPTQKCLPELDTYTVKENENIYQIVQQFRIPLDAIKAANPTLDVENLSPGETLCLLKQQNFTDCSDGQFYFIQEGDTYYRLSRYFYIPLEQLLQANPNTNPNNLQVGQAICIPTEAAFAYCPPSSTPYQLKKGDSFYALSRKFNVSLESILRLNSQANPYQLLIGQMVCFPIQWKFFFTQIHHVAFMHPREWKMASHSPIRYEGEFGFFEVTSIIAAPPDNSENVTTLNELCKDYAYGKFNPFGTDPSIERVSIDGQPACFIIPSSDQSEDFNERAALIIKYPKPYVIGDSLSHYLIIYADKNHIKGIASTMKLLNVEKDRRLTKKQAEKLVRRALGLMDQPEVYVTFDRMIAGKYLIHVYDIVDNHTATRGWYLVDPKTGRITNYMV